MKASVSANNFYRRADMLYCLRCLMIVSVSFHLLWEKAKPKVRVFNPNGNTYLRDTYAPKLKTQYTKTYI